MECQHLNTQQPTEEIVKSLCHLGILGRTHSETFMLKLRHSSPTNHGNPDRAFISISSQRRNLMIIFGKEDKNTRVGIWQRHSPAVKREV